MKILLCSPIVPRKELGASKVLIELMEELQELDWVCKLLSPTDICADILNYKGEKYRKKYTESLRNYLQEKSSEYDVIDYDHIYLPYPRDIFSHSTLFVARSVLLVHHFDHINIPVPNNLKSQISHIIKGASKKAMMKSWIKNASLTVESADLVNVSNYDDQTELTRRGVPKEKICVIPYGLSQNRRLLFNNVPSEPPLQPTVAFVGTFDTRKGSNDFPKIVKYISQAVPQSKFRFLGGINSTEIEVLGKFEQKLRHKIEVISKFKPEELPDLLADCSVGIFPSYLEGFGFGVLEMLAASLPVIAYNTPGPPMMLPSEYLVSGGDVRALSNKVINLLIDHQKLQTARLWAKQQSQQFSWQQIAKLTSEIYLQFLEAKRANNTKSPQFT